MIPVPVTINDGELYYFKGSPLIQSSWQNYAVKMFFLSAGTTDLTKDQIDPLMQGKVMLSLNFFDDFNKEIGKLCTNTPCNYETIKPFKDFFSRVEKNTGHHFDTNYKLEDTSHADDPDGE